MNLTSHPFPLKGAAVRVLPRGDDAQVHLTYHPQLRAVDLRLFRKSRNEIGDLDAFMPTSAGLVLPLAQVRDAAALLLEIAEELGA